MLREFTATCIQPVTYATSRQPCCLNSHGNNSSVVDKTPEAFAKQGSELLSYSCKAITYKGNTVCVDSGVGLKTTPEPNGYENVLTTAHTLCTDIFYSYAHLSEHMGPWGMTFLPSGVFCSIRGMTDMLNAWPTNWGWLARACDISEYYLQEETKEMGVARTLKLT